MVAVWDELYREPRPGSTKNESGTGIRTSIPAGTLCGVCDPASAVGCAACAAADRGSCRAGGRTAAAASGTTRSITENTPSTRGVSFHVLQNMETVSLAEKLVRGVKGGACPVGDGPGAACWKTLQTCRRSACSLAARAPAACRTCKLVGFMYAPVMWLWGTGRGAVGEMCMVAPRPHALLPVVLAREVRLEAVCTRGKGGWPMGLNSASMPGLTEISGAIGGQPAYRA